MFLETIKCIVVLRNHLYTVHVGMKTFEQQSVENGSDRNPFLEVHGGWAGLYPGLPIFHGFKKWAHFHFTGLRIFFTPC